MKKIKLRRHESFSIRDGWIEKGLISMNENGNETFQKEKGIKILGLGSNMVKSLKYWMLSGNLITHTLKAELTDFGKALLKYDKYLDSDFSWCLFHYYLSVNKEDCPVQYYIVNILQSKKLKKEDILEKMQILFTQQDIEYNSKLLLEDINMYFKLYLKNEIKNPEDNFVSPLAKFGLLENGIEEGEFVKNIIDTDKLNYLVVYFSLQNLYEKSFNLQDVYLDEKTPVKIFNIDKGTFSQYLNIMKNKGLITINKTAGLNTVYLNKYFSIYDLFEEYFGG